MTVVGIPLAVVVFAALKLAAALGLIIAAYWLGCPAARAADAPAPGNLRRFGGTALGMLLLMIVVLIPALGALAVFLATAAGLGAFALGVFRAAEA